MSYSKQPSLAAHCSTPMAPTNGAVSQLSPPCANGTCGTGTTAVFTCDSEYLLVGHGTSSCIGRGEWNLPFPTCEGKSECMTVVSMPDT